MSVSTNDFKFITVKGQASGSGTKGEPGEKGDTGSQGPAGTQGPAGSDGSDGSQGPAGVKGQKGAAGPQGVKGQKGATGQGGVKGAQGPIGFEGDKGATGAQGVKGQKGAIGPKGAQGATGPKGQKGATGAQGVKGQTGSKGQKGEIGPQGAGGSGSSPPGPTGPKGQKGEKGAPGDSCFEITTPVLMSDNSTKAYGSIQKGDSIKSVTFEELTSSDVPHVFLNESSTTLTPTLTSSTVKSIKYGSENHYFNINNDFLKVTAEHPLLVKRGDTWTWKRVWGLQTGDKLYKFDNTEVEVTSVTYVTNDWIDWAIMDVEETDNYFVNGILAHNLK